MSNRFEMPSFVLVHGAWHGGWCWRKVLPLLRAAGHEVHAVTLTGVGERAHLMSKDINLATHTQDVRALIEAEELERVILVGHSYGGMIITAVADRMLAEGSTRLEQLVYLDAVVPRPGESWSSTHAPGTIRGRVEMAMSLGGVSMPQADSVVFGLKGPDRHWVNRRQTPHPLKVYEEPLEFDAERVATLPRTFIDCHQPALPTIAAMRQRVRTESGWRVLTLATGHDPMVTEPEALADHLLGIGRPALPSSGTGDHQTGDNLG